MQAILAPCPQVAEDEFLPQHIHLRRFWLHVPQHIHLRQFRLHARKLLRTSFYRNTFTLGDGEKKTKIWIILVVVVGLICLGIHIFLKVKGGEDRSGYGMELKEVDNF
ncbi:hypothetical protein JHK87_042976 [Glycine soja]|nr:hypothetical protein JHK87_042976 [Glycine soja]